MNKQNFLGDLVVHLGNGEETRSARGYKGPNLNSLVKNQESRIKNQESRIKNVFLTT